MRIGIDGRVLLGPTTGIGRYALNLIKHLLLVDSKNEYIIFIDGEPKKDLPSAANCHYQVIHKRMCIPWVDVWLPRELVRQKIDVLHTPTNIGVPHLKLCKFIVTIHDLIPLLLSEYSTKKYLARYRRAITLSVRNADKIITVSQQSRNDIVRLLKVPYRKIEVIYEGVDNFCRPISDQKLLEGIKRKYRIDAPYILHLGGIDEHKNSQVVLKAHRILKTVDKIPALKLVIVGRKDWFFHALSRQAYELGIEDDVIFTDFVSDEDLVLLYNTAQVFVFPSLYEGFGLPTLEAMACGTPVIASNTPSLRETIGEAGILVDPKDFNDFAQAIKQILVDNTLRAKLVELGHQRTGLFLWQETARRTLEVYQSVNR